MTDRDHFAEFIHQDTAKVWRDFGVRMGEMLAEMLDRRISDAMLCKPGTAVLDNCPTGNQPEIGCPVEKAIGRELDAEWYGGPEPDRVVTLRGLLERTI